MEIPAAPASPSWQHKVFTSLRKTRNSFTKLPWATETLIALEFVLLARLITFLPVDNQSLKDISQLLKYLLTFATTGLSIFVLQKKTVDEPNKAPKQLTPEGLTYRRLLVAAGAIAICAAAVENVADGRIRVEDKRVGDAKTRANLEETRAHLERVTSTLKTAANDLQERVRETEQAAAFSTVALEHFYIDINIPDKRYGDLALSEEDATVDRTLQEQNGKDCIAPLFKKGLARPGALLQNSTHPWEFMEGDCFDALADYNRWYESVRFFNYFDIPEHVGLYITLHLNGVVVSASPEDHQCDISVGDSTVSYRCLRWTFLLRGGKFKIMNLLLEVSPVMANGFRLEPRHHDLMTVLPLRGLVGRDLIVNDMEVTACDLETSEDPKQHKRHLDLVSKFGFVIYPAGYEKGSHQQNGLKRALREIREGSKEECRWAVYSF